MNKIRAAIRFIKRFCYYGYHGAKHTVDFDASSMDHLIYAHIKRVNDFMHDPTRTHLLWNSKPENRRMRLLREFTELSARRTDKYEVGYYFSQHCNKWSGNGRRDIFDRINDPQYRKESKIAMRKDNMKKRGEEDRYYYLLRHLVPTFWD